MMQWTRRSRSTHHNRILPCMNRMMILTFLSSIFIFILMRQMSCDAFSLFNHRVKRSRISSKIFWMKGSPRRSKFKSSKNPSLQKDTPSNLPIPMPRDSEDCKEWIEKIIQLQVVEKLQLSLQQQTKILQLIPQKNCVSYYYNRWLLPTYILNDKNTTKYPKIATSWYNLVLSSKLDQIDFQEMLQNLEKTVYFNDFIPSGISPNTETYKILLSACPNAASAEYFLQKALLQNLSDEHDYAIDISSLYNTTHQLCCQDQQYGWNISQSLLEKQKQSISFEDYSSFVDSWIRSALEHSLWTNDEKVSRISYLWDQYYHHILQNCQITRKDQVSIQKLWTQMLHLFSVCGDSTKLLKTLENLPFDNDKSPLVVVTSTHTHWLVTTILKNSTHTGKAIDVFHTYKNTWPWQIRSIHVIINYIPNYSQALKFLISLPTNDPKIPPPDIQSYNMVMSKCENSQQASQLLQRLYLTRRSRQTAIYPTPMTYTHAISACVDDLRMALKFLDLAQKRDGIQPPNVYMYSSAIWVAAKSLPDTKNIDIVLQILKEMKECQQFPNEITYDGVISTLVANNRWDLALDMFEELCEENIKPTYHTYQTLVNFAHGQDKNCAATSNNEDLTISMLEQLWECVVIKVSNPIAATLIRMHGQCGNYVRAKEIFFSIESTADASCLAAMTYVCSTTTPAKWQDAVTIIHSSDIVTGALGPGNIERRALSYAVIACAREEEWIDGINLLELYARNQDGQQLVELDAINSIMAAAGRSGRPDITIQLLNEMSSRYHVPPNERSYKSAIIACHQAERRKRRSHVKQLEIENDLSTEENEDEDDFNDNDDDDQLTFQWWECALSLHRRMNEAGFIPDPQTYSSIIAACEAAGQWQRAIGILKSIDMDAAMNLYCFNAAMSACEKGGAWLEALEMYERTKGTKIKPNFITLNSLLIALDSAEQRELAENIYEEALKEKLIQPWKKSFSNEGSLIRAMDLHQFSKPMAKIAVRNVIDSLLTSNPSHNMTEDLVIIVGKGKGSEGGKSLLTPIVLSLLLEEYGIKSHIDETNSGRIIISCASLLDFVQRSCWVS